MIKLLCVFFLSILSLSCSAKTVKENEVLRSQNVLALFDKGCMQAYLDEDTLSNFLLNNNFEDLNDETHSPSDNKKSSQQANNLIDLSTDGKHYSITNDKKIFFLDITDKDCSVLVKSINQDVFNLYFQDFRKSLTDNSILETSKSFEARKGSVHYQITSYLYFTEDGSTKLPFEFYLTQSNERNVPFQFKLTVHIEKRKEILNKKSHFVNISYNL